MYPQLHPHYSSTIQNQITESSHLLQVQSCAPKVGDVLVEMKLEARFWAHNRQTSISTGGTDPKQLHSDAITSWKW